MSRYFSYVLIFVIFPYFISIASSDEAEKLNKENEAASAIVKEKKLKLKGFLLGTSVPQNCESLGKSEFVIAAPVTVQTWPKLTHKFLQEQLVILNRPRINAFKWGSSEFTYLDLATQKTIKVVVETEIKKIKDTVLDRDRELIKEINYLEGLYCK